MTVFPSYLKWLAVFYFFMKTHEKSTHTSTWGIISEIAKVCLSVSCVHLLCSFTSFHRIQFKIHRVFQNSDVISDITKIMSYYWWNPFFVAHSFKTNTFSFQLFFCWSDMILCDLMETALLAHKTSNLFFIIFHSVPTFQGLPEEILSKLADVLEEVSHWTVLYKTLCIFSEEPVSCKTPLPIKHVWLGFH